ncbi:MAG: p-hydroxycinnamoyl CoA hydratase/lyase [Acidimicrobiales bacterium]
MSASQPLVMVEVTDQVATLTLNRPKKKNAMSPALHAEMLDRLTELKDRSDFKILIVTGSGDSFCAGMDLEECFMNPFEEPERFAAENKTAQAWFRLLKSFPVPTVAKVNGWCFGGGVLIVGLCDMAIAADDVTFGLSEINFGSFPGGGTTWSVAHNIGRKHALYLILTGKPFDAAEAERIGLINLAVPRADLDAEVASLAETICKKHRPVLIAAKEVYEGSHDKSFAESIDWEMAKLYELSYITGHDWITKALRQFADREYRPGFESYRLDE